MTVPVSWLLKDLGFTASQAGTSLSYDFGNLVLRATEGMNRWFQPCWTLAGVMKDSRKILLMEFEMPAQVETQEQGVAWIAEHLDRAGYLLHRPDWLEQGHLWRNELPWRKKQKAYQNRPRCTVERDWFRLPCKTLRQIGEAAGLGDWVEVYFTGKALEFRTKDAFLVMPASGTSWPEAVRVSATALLGLPKRLMSSSIEVSIFERQLTIANLRIPLIEAGALLEAQP